MYDPKGIGERSEAMILAALLRHGRTVLKPWGDNQRYDLVIDEGGGKFSRVQCKTARFSADRRYLVFSACSNAGGYKKKHYREQIEVFAVYSPDLDKVFMVPVNDANTSETYLWLEKPTINRRDFRFASSYELVAG